MKWPFAKKKVDETQQASGSADSQKPLSREELLAKARNQIVENMEKRKTIQGALQTNEARQKAVEEFKQKIIEKTQSEEEPPDDEEIQETDEILEEGPETTEGEESQEGESTDSENEKRSEPSSSFELFEDLIEDNKEIEKAVDAFQMLIGLMKIRFQTKGGEGGIVQYLGLQMDNLTKIVLQTINECRLSPMQEGTMETWLKSKEGKDTVHFIFEDIFNLKATDSYEKSSILRLLEAFKKAMLNQNHYLEYYEEKGRGGIILETLIKISREKPFPDGYRQMSMAEEAKLPKEEKPVVLKVELANAKNRQTQATQPKESEVVHPTSTEFLSPEAKQALGYLQQLLVALRNDKPEERRGILLEIGELYPNFGRALMGFINNQEESNWIGLIKKQFGIASDQEAAEKAIEIAQTLNAKYPVESKVKRA